MSYQWFFDGSAISGATSSTYTILTLLGSDTGVYCVEVSNSGGSVMSSNAYLNVTPPPGIASQPQSLTVTQGQNASFSVGASGTGPFTYQWYFNGSSMGNAGSSATLSLNNVASSQAGGYFAVVANSTGSATSSVATLTVYVPPGIQTPPQSLVVTQGQNASFSVVPTGSQPFSYQWLFNNVAIPGATSSSLTFSNAQSSQAGNYTVSVSNPAGTVTSQTAALTVNVPAAITAQPQSESATNGQAVSFSVIAAGSGSLNYHWYFNGSTLPGAGNNSSVTLSSVGTNNAGNYLVVVQNSFGSVTSSVAVLTVVTPPVITQQPQSRTALPGSDVAFGVAASGSGPLAYAWTFDGTPLPGATNSVLELSNVSAAVAGSYSVIVSNSLGSASSAVATLTVLVAIPVSGVAAPAMTPAGFSFQLSVPAGHTYIILATSDLIRWTPISTNVAVTGSESFTDPDASNHQSRMYRAVVQ